MTISLFKMLITNAIKSKIVCCLSFVLLAQAGITQQHKNTVVVPLKNDKYVSIQACTEQIYRIRISAGTDFPETLMERYSILKTDWETLKITSRKEKGNRIIQTTGYQLIIHEANGTISVKDNNDQMIIRTIQMYPDGDQPVGKALGQSLQQYFGKEKREGNIIGDVNDKKPALDNPGAAPIKMPSVVELSLSPDERFYGGGSTSRKNIQHRGSALRMWATYQQTEIPMPFVMSSEGWGIFNNTTSLNYFDIGRFQKDNLYLYNSSGDIDFYLLLGNSMEEAIHLYTTLTGKPYLLPKWAYGLAFGGNTMEDQLDVMNDAVRFRDEKIPCDIFWLEPQWMAKYYDFSTSKNWDLKKFPAEPYWEADKYPKYESPTLFISRLHDLGFKLALWLCIDHDLSIEEEDHWADKTGKPQSGQEHWFEHLTRFMDQGVDGFKLDPGRTLDEHPDRKYYNGYTDKEMHNLNQVLLPKQMYQTFRSHKKVRSFHHYCGGYAGSQHWGASTSGDNGGGKDALFDQLNLGLSGFVNTSADVMQGITDNRAGMHFGFFLPWVQVNSWFSLLHPWYLSPGEKETFRFYAQLRNSLSPYIYSAALQGSQTGMPILRAMPLMFPDDRQADNMIHQYMFGENLLVGIFSDSIYLPEGNWINYWTSEKVSGGKTVHCKVPENRGGLLFIKSGAIIPCQKPRQYIGEHPMDTLLLKVFPEKQSTCTFWEDDGRTFDYETGQITKTRFECMATDKKTDFIIHPREGHYTGMPGSRTWQMEISLPEKPTRIAVNGHITNSWEYDTTGKVTLWMHQQNLSQKQVIEIMAN